MNLPINTTLQLSDISGNIAHQAVLASNINGSELLTSYPTTTTGQSTGHYHFTDPSTLGLNLLNLSADSDGGFKFSNASNNNTPETFFEVDRNQATLNTKLTNYNNSLSVNLSNPSFQIIDGPNSLLMTLEKNHLNMSGPTTQSNVYNNEINLKYNDNTNGIVFNCPNDAYGTGMQCYNNNSKILMISNPNQPQVFLSNGPQTTYNSLELDKVNINNGTINTVNLNGTTKSLTLNDGTHNSVLSTTDLLFDNVSLVSTVSTNTSNISTNTSNIATNTSNIATNTANIATNTSNITTLQNQSYNIISTPITVLCSPLVYGTSPSLPPIPMYTSSSASNIINQGYNGWFFRNFTAGSNIGWMAGFASTTSTVGDLLQLSFTWISANTTTSPQLTVYTLPPTSPNFFNSRRAYVNTGTITANTPYLYYKNFNGYTGVPFKSGHFSVSLSNTVISNVGAFGTSEQLYFWSVGTNSGASVNSVELVVSGMNSKMTYNGGTIINQPYIFNNSEVINPQPVISQNAGTVIITPYNFGSSFGCLGDVTINNSLLRAQDAGFWINCTNAKSSGAVGVTFTGSAGSTIYVLQSSGTTVSLSWAGTYWVIV
jgi:hypothetical protein